MPPDGVAFGIKEFPEGIALIFRGSATLQDWLRNAEAIADPSAHQGLGRCIRASSLGFLNCGRGSSRDRRKSPVLLPAIASAPRALRCSPG